MPFRYDPKTAGGNLARGFDAQQQGLEQTASNLRYSAGSVDRYAGERLQQMGMNGEFGRVATGVDDPEARKYTEAFARRMGGGPFTPFGSEEA